MSSAMDTASDSIASVARKIRELKNEVYRQEEIEVLKKRIARDTARLKLLQEKKHPGTVEEIPILTEEEVAWVKGHYCVHLSGGVCPCGKNCEGLKNSITITGIIPYKYARSVCATTDREIAFCMCGKCVFARDGTKEQEDDLKDGDKPVMTIRDAPSLQLTNKGQLRGPCRLGGQCESINGKCVCSPCS
jgi:hypothetical protein